MARKTYAARGLLDWQMALNVGGAILRICFSGGTMGCNGVVPATYITENEAVQRIIESTPFYTCGKIFLLRVEDAKPSADSKSAKKNNKGDSIRNENDYNSKND